MDMFVYRGRDSDRNSDVGGSLKEPSTVSLARIIFIRCVAPRVLDLGQEGKQTDTSHNEMDQRDRICIIPHST